MLNKFLLHHRNQGEQGLLHDLVTETIQGHGLECFYVPKEKNEYSNYFGENQNTEYKHAVPMELYVSNVEAWEGEGDMLSMFGMEFKDKITFIISQHRWKQLRGDKIVLSNGRMLQLSGIKPYNPNAYNGIALSQPENEKYVLPTRPHEGDLIYLKLNNTILKILHVEHESNFYPLGTLPIYELRCEKFDYSSETIDTDIEEVDAIEDTYSYAKNNDAILLSNNEPLVLSNGNILITSEGSGIIKEDPALATGLDPETEELEFPTNNPESPKKPPLLDSNDNIIENDDNDTDVIDNTEKHPFNWGWDL
jgi:hypothetical protein